MAYFINLFTEEYGAAPGLDAERLAMEIAEDAQCMSRSSTIEDEMKTSPSQTAGQSR